MVYKSQNVLAAGGVGMILLNVAGAATTLFTLPHSVPTVHLPASAREAIRAYAASAQAAARASLSQVTFVNDDMVAVPTMSSFSSRGPLPANIDLLKPDMAGMTLATRTVEVLQLLE